MVDLKSFLPKSDIPARELFWSVILEPGWVQAGVWQLDGELVKVVSTSNPVAWEGDEGLLSSADAALSSCVNAFAENEVGPTKTVFGVPDYWVNDGQIKAEYLAKIKIICQKLQLVPVGFVVLSEAVAHFLKFQDGEVLNGLVIRVSSFEFEISLFEAGSQIETTLVARSVSVIEDIVEGFSRLMKDDKPFPPRIVLFDGKGGEIDEIKNTILETDWGQYEKIKFLHPPRVEEILPDKKVLAVSLAGGAEMGGVSGVENAGNVEPVGSETVVDLGFEIEKDITQEEKKPLPPSPVLPKNNRFSVGNIIRSSSKNFFQGRRLVTHDFSGNSNKKVAFVGIFLLAALFVGGFVYWWFAPTAVVTIYVSPQTLEESVGFYIDPKVSSIDMGGKVIPGSFATQSESGSRTKAATGSKVVGDKSKGEIKLFRSGAQVTLAAGTKITGPNNLNFVLDGETLIASGSAATPATKNASVTADKIGSEYNLGAGSSFRISNYPTSEIEAKNDNAFSGGSSREITAVSADDQKSLEDALTVELMDKAEADITRNLDSTTMLIAESLTTKTTNSKFSAKIGDEAQTVDLSLGLDMEGLIVNKKDVAAIARETLKGKIPNGFVLRDDQLNLQFKYIGEKDGRREMVVKIKANLLPQIDEKQIIDKIAGRYPDVAEEYFKESIGGYNYGVINLTPQLLGKLAIIPRVKNNIKIVVQAAK